MHLKWGSRNNLSAFVTVACRDVEMGRGWLDTRDKDRKGQAGRGRSNWNRHGSSDWGGHSGCSGRSVQWSTVRYEWGRGSW